MLQWVGLGMERATRRITRERIFWTEETATENKMGSMGTRMNE